MPRDDWNHEFNNDWWQMGQVFHKELRYTLSGKWKTDNEPEELDHKVIVYQPESLEHLLCITKFNRRELKVMYRGFKQACPSGFITLEDFKDIFAKIFPQGGTEIASVLSTLSRGSMSEKLEWTFRLYDLDRDGYITFNELLRVMFAIYDLMGINTDPPPDRFYVKARAREMFHALDTSGSGVISRQEFSNAYLNNPILCESLEAFNTFL